MRTRRDFLKKSGAVALGTTLAAACGPGEGPSGRSREVSGNSESLLRNNPDHPRPATVDRLPLEWHKSAVRRLQEKLGERGLDGILITDLWNIIYFTGLFHTRTERPFACFIPTRELAVHWFYPGLDRDLVKNWWFSDGDYYFDFPHAEGGFPNQGKTTTGPTVDLLEWRLKGIAKLGFGNRKIGLDISPLARTLKRMTTVLPRAKFEEVGDICMKMRVAKTPEEIALMQRAYNYFSRIHAFTRDYILQYGTDATDFQVRMAATEYGHDLVLNDIQRDGRPHTAVGIRIGISCRTGVGTAYPHPNQFHHNRIKKGDSIQISGGVRIGGYGGELYSPCQIAPWDSKREKMWEVMAEGSAMQVRLSKAGTRCQEVAEAIHHYQVKQGMQNYIYHRPAHGEGMEGHQEPYISLGDETVLEEGMTFSMEPGLYNPEGGYGYNPSDLVLVAREKGIALGSVPMTKEWCFLKL